MTSRYLIPLVNGNIDPLLEEIFRADFGRALPELNLSGA